MDIAAWLQSQGLERYVTAFRDNEIDWEVITEADVGGSQGDRRCSDRPPAQGAS
jgi:hypothetical protein